MTDEQLNYRAPIVGVCFHHYDEAGRFEVSGVFSLRQYQTQIQEAGNHWKLFNLNGKNAHVVYDRGTIDYATFFEHLKVFQNWDDAYKYYKLKYNENGIFSYLTIHSFEVKESIEEEDLVNHSKFFIPKLKT